MSDYKSVVVITGSSQGIGLGMAREFLARECAVMINGRDAVTLQRAKEELEHVSPHVAAVQGSVTDMTVLLRLVNETRERFGRVDYWINNAGLSNSYLPFSELEEAEIRRVIETNVTASLLGTQVALRTMLDQGHGSIFLMEGLGSDGRQVDKLGVYGSSKRAISYFARSLGREMKGTPLRCGVISPGMVRTRLTEEPMSEAGAAERAAFDKILAILGEDVATVAPFLVDKVLASRKAFTRIRYLTGRKVALRFMKQAFRVS